MFFLEWTIALVVMFWVSAFLAEALLTSSVEMALPASNRVSLAFLFSLAWFAATMVLFSIQTAWLISLVMLVLRLLGKPRAVVSELLRLRQWPRRYVPAFLAFLLLGNGFILPLHVSRIYGPFTEGGGDVTVYADVAKYFSDRRLPMYGWEDWVRDFKLFIRLPLAGRLEHRSDLESLDVYQANPPLAEYQCHRFLATKSFPSIQFSPTAQWSFLSGQTNLPVFYANLAFLYAVMVVSFWAFLRCYGWLPSLLGAIIVISSHGLISVFYNMYLLQALSLAVTAVLLSLLGRVPLLSWSGLRCFGIPTGIVLVGYAHFLVVLAPLLALTAVPLLRSWPALGFRRGNQPQERSANALNPLDSVAAPQVSRVSVFLGRLTSGIAVLILAIWLVGGTMSSISMYGPLVSQIFERLARPVAQREVASLMMGNPTPVWGWQWLSFLFGVVSQQHYQPLASPSPLSIVGAQIGVCVGVFVLLSSGVMWGLLFADRKVRPRMTRPPVLSQPSSAVEPVGGRSSLVYPLLLYASLLVTVLLQLLPAQANLYTQAKGAQNVLLALYAALLLPFGVAMSSNPGESSRGLRALKLYGAGLLALGLALLGSRLVFGWMLTLGRDRCAILEPSYFSEAARIRREDPEAVVLVESRKSADAYLAAQPFHQGLMMLTRHLALTTIDRKAGAGPSSEIVVNRERLASDFVSARDLPHLWFLAARKTGETLFGRDRYFAWNAVRLERTEVPKLILSGHDYEPFFRRDPRGGTPPDIGWFSYVRNGSALLVLPRYQDRMRIEAVVQPRAPSDFDTMVAQLATTGDEGLWDRPAVLQTYGSFIRCEYDLGPPDRIRLIRLPRYWGEFWINVRVNGQELQP